MPLLSADELGKELGVSGSHIRRLAASGKVPAYRLGDSWRFDLDTVLAASKHISTHDRDRKALDEKVNRTLCKIHLRKLITG